MLLQSSPLLSPCLCLAQESNEAHSPSISALIFVTQQLKLCLLLHKSITQLQLLVLLVILPLYTKTNRPNTLAACTVLCHPIRYLLIHLSMILLNYHQSQADHAFLLGISTSHLSIPVSLRFKTITLRLEFTDLSLASFRRQGKGMQWWNAVWFKWKYPFFLLHDKTWQAAHNYLWLMHHNWEKLQQVAH